MRSEPILKTDSNIVRPTGRASSFPCRATPQPHEAAARKRQEGAARACLAFWQGLSGHSSGGGPFLPLLRAQDRPRGRHRGAEGAEKGNGSGAGGVLGGGTTADESARDLMITIWL